MQPQNQASGPEDLEKNDVFTFDAFLSYSRQDSELVRDLVYRLEEKQITVWFDERQIDVGDSITARIQQGLSGSRYLVVCLSSHYRESEWCSREYNTHLIQEIKARTVRVLPVRLDDYSDEDVPDFLFDKYAVDIRTDDGLSRLIRKLKTKLQAQSGRFAVLLAGEAQKILAENERSREGEAGLEAAIQLWFPHQIARSFFDMTQASSSRDRAKGVEKCFKDVIDILTVMSLADYAVCHDISDLKPLVTDLDGKVLSERIELLSKIINATGRNESFIPHLAVWAMESDSHPSLHFLALFKLALALHSKDAGEPSVAKHAEDLLRQLLGSLLWLQSYRFIEIGDVQRPHPTLIKGNFKSFVGVVKGFLPESFCWQVSPASRVERGCFLLNPARTGLLSLDSLLLTREEIAADAVHVDGGDLWLFSGIQGADLIVRNSSGDRSKRSSAGRSFLVGHGYSRRRDRMIAIKSVDERIVLDLEGASEPDEKIGDASLDDAGHGYEETPPSDYGGWLTRIQRALLSLGGRVSPSDSLLIELDGVGADLLAAFERFPGQAESFQEIAIEWSRHIDQALECLPDAEPRLVLGNRRREVEVRLEDLLGGFSRGEAFFMSGSRYRAEPLYASEAVENRDLEYGLKLLLNKDELDQSDGIEWLLGGGYKGCEDILEQIARSGRRDRVLGILWRRFARIFLYYREPFWDLAKYMLRAEPARWRWRLESFRRILERDTSADEARSIVSALGEEDQPVVAAFLAMHPRRSCREVGISFLQPADRWEILLAPATHAAVVRELIEASCKDCSPSYIKAMFLLIRSRLRSADTPLALNHAFEILKIFYGVPLFLEAAFFKALLALHKALSFQAQASLEMAEVRRRFEKYFDEFRRRIQARDMEITEMRHIPLPVQRKLARDGYFVEVFICNVRDPIALEAVPYAVRRSDAIRFFKANLINKSALQRMAEDKHVMREHSIKAAFCRNPKADPKQIRKYMPQLGVVEFKSISEDRNVSQYARAFAKQLLQVKTS